MAELELGRRRVSVHIEEPPIGSDRYTAIWRDAAAVYPDYDAYKTRTSRQIPVVELIPDRN